MIDRYLRKLRLRSFFVRIFLAHVIVLGLLLCVFYGYVSNLFSQHYTERVEAAVSGMLRNSCTAVDVTLLTMVHSMRQTLENQNVIRAMVTPNLQDYPRTVAIVEQLRNSVAGSMLVRAAALYVPTGDTLFSFDGTVTDADESAWAGAIDAYREGYRSTAYANGLLVSHVRLLGERIFVYQDFFPKHLENIGTLVFEIDVPRFYEMVFESAEGDSGSIYLFDAFGTPVFPGILDYTRAAGADSEEVYRQRSPLSGWTLLYLPSAEGAGSAGNIVPVRRVFFPFALAVVLLSLPLSLYVSTRVYRPMKRLMTRISPGGDALPTGSELDYFDRVYADAKEHNERLRSAIEAISPAVLERLFQNLLLGREVGRREIEETLATLAVPFEPDARYSVVLLSLALPGTNDESPSEVEMNLRSMAVRDRLDKEAPKGVACFTLRIADTTLALVVRFADALSPAEVRQALAEIRDVVRTVVNRGHDEVFDSSVNAIGQGEVYAHIEDVRFSYLEALEDLHHSRFYGETGVSGDPDEPGESHAPGVDNRAESATTSGRAYFSRRCEHILQSLNEGDPARASDILRRVADEIFADGADPGEAAQSCRLFADCLLETLVVQRGSGFKQLSKFREELDASPESGGEDAGAARERILAFGERVIAKIRSHNKKRSKRYIRTAEEYIANNFSDASLSLNMSAEHVGLNASYFSRLFGEMTGRHFTDYLSELRVEKACELLTATDMSIKDVAYRTGFNSMQNYFRVFKRYKGMTPGEYRGRGKR